MHVCGQHAKECAALRAAWGRVARQKSVCSGGKEQAWRAASAARERMVGARRGARCSAVQAAEVTAAC